MPSLLQTGILELSEDEFNTLIEIFDTFPENVILASSYICIKHGLNTVPITDAMIVAMAELTAHLEKEDHKALLIERILKFRSNAELAIS